MRIDRKSPNLQPLFQYVLPAGMVSHRAADRDDCVTSVSTGGQRRMSYDGNHNLTYDGYNTLTRALNALRLPVLGGPLWP